MAQRSLLVDDLDGSEAAETVRYGIDGESYSIDLSAANAKKLRDFLAKYNAVARKRGNGSNGHSSEVDLNAVRQWAKQNRIKVAPKGRIAQDVMNRYTAANPPQDDKS
jgi:hypothetical protein